jgi:carbon-monoxide dehydrogenase catalytic subunit
MADDVVGLTADPAAQEMLRKARERNIETGWDRFQAMQDACAFGTLGICCRNCMMGPCRIDPFGEGPQRGVCGINADGIVARNFCRMIATGASAHSDHGAHMLEVLEKVGDGVAMDFRIKDPEKLRRTAEAFALSENGGGLNGLVRELARVIERTYGQQSGDNAWMDWALPAPRRERLRRLGLLPWGIDPIIRQTLHRTHMGVDADAVNLLLGGIQCALADFLAMDVSSHMSDILLGTPAPRHSVANLGVLDPGAVNIAVHGHNPLVSESILAAVPQFEEAARAAGAAHGINVVGICCTGNEVSMRHGIPLATNAASQELAVLTGALEAIVVDVQCIMPSLANLCECYHTQLVTTMSIAKIPGAEHVAFTPESAGACAATIIKKAIAAFRERNPKRVDIPDVKRETLVGFSLEAVVEVMKKLNADDPIGALGDVVASDAIHGVVLFAGCNNYKVPQDSSFIAIAERLAAENVLMLATGCAAGAFAKRGFLSPEATGEICGDKLRGVLRQLGAAAGFDRALPPVWHMGSCVDNTRAARLAFALANRYGLDVDKLPVVASAPEVMSEKAVAIGTGAVALGLTTHLGVVPPVLGGKAVTQMLTSTVKDLLGACFIVEPDPAAAAQKILDTLVEKRISLGWS